MAAPTILPLSRVCCLIKSVRSSGGCMGLFSDFLHPQNVKISKTGRQKVRKLVLTLKKLWFELSVQEKLVLQLFHLPK